MYFVGRYSVLRIGEEENPAGVGQLVRAVGRQMESSGLKLRLRKSCPSILLFSYIRGTQNISKITIRGRSGCTALDNGHSIVIPISFRLASSLEHGVAETYFQT